MAHVQGSHIGLWKPQNLTTDKISSQKMFVDNMDLLEEFALSVIKRSTTPVPTIAALRAINTSDTMVYIDGTTVMVKAKGLYFFDRGNTTTDNGDTIIAPTTGGGRWISDRTFLGSLAFKNSLSKSDVGLGNVDNTSDANKPVSTAQATAIADAKKAGTDAQTNLTAHTSTKTNPHGVTKEQVGLGNVPNVATNDQTPTFTQASTLTNVASGEKLSVLFGKVMKGLADLISHLANKSNPHGVTKTQVGLGNVDNTSDMDKPVSTATQEVLDSLSGGSAGQLVEFNSHKNNTSNPHSVTKTQVGLGNVPNVATNDQTPTYTAASTLATLTSGEKLSVSFGKIMKGLSDLISHLGSKANPHGVTATQVGLGNVDNTSDANKPVSTAQATSIADAKKAGTDAQTNLTAHTNTKTNPHGVTATQVGLGNVPNVATNDQVPTYTQATTLTNLTSGEKISVSFGKIMKGLADLISHLANKSNPHGVTKTQVGLGNVDNTSDANKPISTATQAALDKCAKIQTDGEIGSQRFNRLTGFALVDGIDLNTVKHSGQYGVGISCQNRPVSTGTYDMLEVIMYSTHWLIQRYYVLNSAGVISGVYYRSYISDLTWTTWKLYNINTILANTMAVAEVIDE